MQQQIVPNLWFDTEAEEAAALYTSIFPNSRVVNVLRHTEAGPGPAGSAVAVEFELNGNRVVGINGGPEFKFTEAVSLQIVCDTQEEVDHYWERLTDGGEEGPCGWLKDRYGLSWQVNPVVLGEIKTPGATRTIVFARCASSEPSRWFTSADARLMIPSARVTGRGMRSSPILKLCRERSVCAPQ